MTRTTFALAIAVVGAVFSVVSGTPQAAPMAPRSAVASHDSGSAKPVSWHEGRGSDHRKRSGFGRGGMFAKFGHFQSLLGMLGSGQGGGMMSMLGGGGGGGGFGDMGGITSMLGGMAGSGDMGGMASMLGGMGGSGGMGGMGGITSMLGGMAGSGGAGGFTSMLGGSAGSGGGQSTSIGHVSQSARQACTPDAMRLCSDYIPDVGKITACMRAKSAQLSEPCRAAMNSEGATTSRVAGRGVAGSVRSQGLASQGLTSQGLTSYGGSESAANFGGGQSGGNFEAGDGYDSAGAVSGLGGGGFDIGRMMGMARSFGFSQRGGW